jgi:chitinase
MAGALAGLLILTAGACSGAPTPHGGSTSGGQADKRSSPPVSGSGSAPQASGVREIGYFPQWAYTHSYLVKDLVTSGNATRMTTLDYAFANVAPEGGAAGPVTCQSGDVQSDYTRPMSSAESVDGVADTNGQKLAGNFGQLVKLKKRYPNLTILLSLGGETWSTYFSDAALTAQARSAFVSSCVDRFIKGNLPAAGSGIGGPGSAAGLFDGFDVDWEWPATDDTGHNHVRPQDKQNLTLLLQEFRKQLDAYSQQTHRRYQLSEFVPADPTEIAAGFEGSKIFSYLDYINVQGYDFHGDWESQTNQQSAINVPTDSGSDPDFSVDTAVKAWRAAGAKANQIVVGIPAYGHGWTGVNNRNDGLFQPAGGLAKGTYDDGTEDFKVLETLTSKGFTLHRDSHAGFAWLFDGDTFWTFDDPTVVAAKAAYIRKNSLGGAMVWDLSGDDTHGTLLTALDTGLKAE